MVKCCVEEPKKKNSSITWPNWFTTEFWGWSVRGGGDHLSSKVLIQNHIGETHYLDIKLIYN